MAVRFNCSEELEAEKEVSARSGRAPREAVDLRHVGRSGRSGSGPSPAGDLLEVAIGPRDRATSRRKVSGCHDARGWGRSTCGTSAGATVARVR